MKKTDLRESLITLITFYPPWDNGRVLRAYDTLRLRFKTNLITTGSQIPIEYIDENITLIKGGFTRGAVSYFKNLIKFIFELNRINSKLIIFFDYYTAPIYSITKYWMKYDHLIYDMFEYYPKKKNMTPRELFFHYFEKRIVREANGLIVANEIRGLLTKKHFKPRSKPVVIGNYGFTNRNLRKYTNSRDISLLKIVYMGNLSSERNLIEFVKIISELEDRFEFHIYGYGPLEFQLKELIESNRYLNIFFHNKYNQVEMHKILTTMDIGFLFYPNTDDNNKYCAPLKVHDYASAGLVMISFHNSSLEELFKKYQIGISSDNIVLALEEIATRIDLMREQLNTYLSVHNYQNEQLKLIRLIEQETYEDN
jgi:glycosyltransferase involved in cell wall biosynthesis